jgi:iron complex outermembrane recepter protein
MNTYRFGWHPPSEFLAATSTLALIVALLPGPAAAQEEAPLPSSSEANVASAPQDRAAPLASGAAVQGGLQDIVVTARKRTENLRDVPVAVTAVTAITLQEKNIVRITDLVSVVPNFTLSLAALQPFTFIRGFGSGGNASFEQSVGKFIDNVSYGRDFDGRIPIYDVEQLEVLKGPQVLLYGNSATAGSLNITTKKPGSSFSADASTSYEFNNQEVQFQGGITVPLTDWASVRVGGLYQNLARGWIDNAANGRHEPTMTIWGVRPSLRLTPAAGLEILLKAQVDRIDDRGTTSQPIRQSTIPIRQMPEVTLDDRRNSNYDVAPFFMKEFSTIHGATYQGDVNYDLGSATLSSTTAYRRIHLGSAQGNGSNKPTVIPHVDQRYQQFSEELRLTGKTGELDYVLGGYYQRDILHVFQLQPLDLSAYGLPIPPLDRFVTFDQQARNYSVFADLTYNLTSAFSLAFGARYSIIRKTSDQSSNPTSFVGRINFNTPRSLGTALLNPALNAAFTAAFGQIPHNFYGIKTREEHLQPQVIAQYRLSPKTMLYAKYVKGDKAGGVDFLYGGSVARGATPDDARFAPEKAQSFEAGIKGMTDDNRLEFSLVGFNTTFSNLQTSVFVGTTLFVANVGKARSRGLEMELTYAPVTGLRLNGSAAFQDARYLDYRGGACTTQQTIAATCSPATGGQDLSGARTPFGSKYSASFGAEYSQPVGDYRVTGGASLVYKSSYNTSINNDPLGDQKGFAALDAHLDLKPEVGWWTLAVFGRNLTNQMYKEYSVGTPLVPGAFNVFLSRGRQIGVRLGASF